MTKFALRKLVRPVAILIACALLPPDGASGQVKPPLRVLLITGGGYHDYAAQKDILARGITDRVNAKVTIDDEAGTDSGFRVSRHKNPNWIRDFDLVLYNICFADVKDNEWSEAIVRAHVVSQVPAVVLHCTMHSYNFRGDSPIWSMFLGVRTQRHQRQMPYTVEVLQPRHPIMANFPASWPTPQGELYEILDVYPTATPLAQAFGAESKKQQPTVWTNRFAGVRVFGTTIGHHNETMQTKEYMDLLAAGVLWAANKLDESGKPLPGYEARNQRRRVVFVAGPRSHGYGAHEHNAGSLLLARLLEENHKQIDPVVYQNGWPSDPNAFDGAAAVVIFANGGMGNPAVNHLPELQRIMDQGTGLVLLHYAVEIPADSGGKEFLDWAGGHFAINWSVNPVWTMQSQPFPNHPIARGLKPYEINDEWYYHMRFREGRYGVQPILSALPPASSLSRPDGLHSGNPAVRAAVLERKEPQHLAWAAERANGGRGFGFTGAHFHWNWGHPMQRRLVLNAIAWAAHAEVPAGGVPIGVLTMEDLEANQDDPKPANFDRERWRLLVEQWQRDFPVK